MVPSECLSGSLSWSTNMMLKTMQVFRSTRMISSQVPGRQKESHCPLEQKTDLRTGLFLFLLFLLPLLFLLLLLVKVVIVIVILIIIIIIVLLIFIINTFPLSVKIHIRVFLFLPPAHRVSLCGVASRCLLESILFCVAGY